MSLTYNKGTTHSAPVFIGVRIAGHIELGNGAIITPNLSLAWRYDLMPGRTATAALAMAPGSTFKVSGARPDANALQARLSIHGQITRHLAIFASVEGDFAGSSGNYTGRAGAALTW
jgi:outer membrane autotransporter protein